MLRLEELIESIHRIFIFRHFALDNDVRASLLGIEIGEENVPGICIRVYIFSLFRSFQCTWSSHTKMVIGDEESVFNCVLM